MERRSPPPRRRATKRSPAAPVAPAPLGPEAWLTAAWNVMAREGVAGIRVEPLAAALGVTKGSFYWHFRDRAALLDALLDDWEERATRAVIVQVDASSCDARERLFTLMRLSTAAPEAPDIEHAVRAWGAHDAAVRKRLARLDRQREQYVSALLVSAGVEPDEASLRARMLYLALIGEYARVAHGGDRTEPRAWASLLTLLLPPPSR